MIKADMLVKEFKPEKLYENGNDVTLPILQSRLKEAAEKYQIPIAFTNDQIKYGGVFNSTTIDCLVVYHPEHPSDYLRYTVSIKRQGTIAYVAVHLYGKSKQIGKKSLSKGAVASLKEGKVGTAILMGVLSLGKNKDKLKDEENYNHAIWQIFDEVIFES